MFVSITSIVLRFSMQGIYFISLNTVILYLYLGVMTILLTYKQRWQKYPSI